MMCNNPNLDLVNIDVYTKFGEILQISSQDIERKRNFDRQTDGMTDKPGGPACGEEIFLIKIM